MDPKRRRRWKQASLVIGVGSVVLVAISVFLSLSGRLRAEPIDVITRVAIVLVAVVLILDGLTLLRRQPPES